MKLLKFTHYIDKKQALIHRYNAYFRLLDGDNKEYFYYSLDKAILHLLNEGYSTHLNI